MRMSRAILAIVLASCASVADLLAQEAQEDPQPYFSLTSERTYLPGEKIEVAVYSSTTSARCEFRVYRVNDPVKFFSQLQDMHSFGGQAPRLPKQAQTWLERFHAWKHRIWAWFRDFIRAQFSPDSRHEIRLWRTGRNRAAEEGSASRRICAGARFSTSSNWSRPGSGRSRPASAGRARTSRFRSATRASIWSKRPTARCAPTPSSWSPKSRSSPRLRPDAC